VSCMKLLKRESPVNFKNHRVRVVDIDGKPWFVAADVCAVLGIANVSDACSNLGQDENRAIRVNGGRYGRPSLIITESALYKLVMRSDKDKAKEFQDWVTRDVLPAIRKDGGHVSRWDEAHQPRRSPRAR
jgi:prophage antirepressor-like protein